GVLLGGTAVSCPAGMADAERAIDGARLNGVFEISQLALGAANGELIVFAIDGKSGGVITPVLQALATFQNDGRGLVAPDVANDSAHNSIIVATASKNPARRRYLLSWYDSSGKIRNGP